MKVKRNKALAVEMARVKQGHDRLNNFDGDCGRGNGQSSCELPGASWDLNMKNQESADQNHLTSSSSSAILQQRNWWSRQTIRCQNLVIGVSGMVVAIALVALLVDKFGHQAQRQSSPDSETPTLHPELLTPRSPLHASGQVIGPCTRARAEHNTAFVPACRVETGDFEPLQCNDRTSECWCSHPDGLQIPNTLVKMTALPLPDCSSILRNLIDRYRVTNRETTEATNSSGAE